MEPSEVAVVGAGLAGLTCARALEEAGLQVTVLERSTHVGGRCRTEVIDGFRCDVGFQTLNTAYPALLRHADVTALNVQALQLTMVLADPSGYRMLGDPRRSDLALTASLRAMGATPRDIARMQRWVDPVRRPLTRLFGSADQSLAASFVKEGLDGALLDRVIKPYLSFLIGDDDGATSYQFALLMSRMYARGGPGLPSLGMQALPDQLAFELELPVRHGVEVREVRRRGDEHGGVQLVTSQGEIEARAVVVATDPPTAAKLLGLGTPVMRGTTTWWFATRVAPTTMKMVFVDPDAPGSGPLAHSSVVSNVAPRYAPEGWHLVQATAPLTQGRAALAGDEASVRAHLSRIFRTSTDAWELVTRHVVPEAYVATPPPLVSRRDVDLGDGLFVAGDHRDTASIQGAIVSGRRAARAVRELLAS